MCDHLLFYYTLGGLNPGTYLSALVTFPIFMTMFFVVNISCVTLFDDINREYFDIVKLIPMAGEKVNAYKCRRRFWSSQCCCP